ncbi:hypothetical protein LAZ67_11000266 [Cordylochernes scorpioides]|uniref:Mos1 transposase HTH domain-containing protein n=1 Tax=Cordylochernes scorpioides TaxID=51811 RepID=A0ABY6KXQ2_9ARAC|nr:hypothetical protein LAZ67_11000266 [Cordylochernes scorpioides]
MVISEPKSAHLREVLLFAFNWKKSATEAHRMLEEVYGDHALSKSQCYWWFEKFQSGDFELDNEPRGKPHQKFEDAELQALLDDDSTQTQEKLAKQLQTGVVYFKLLKPGETVNTSRYEQQMHSLREALNEKRPDLREKHNKLILQHDNAPAHNATVVKNTINDLGWELLHHPPYSPYLAPSDYHLFTSLGHALKNQEFSNSDILRKWLVDWFDSKGIEFFRQGIRKLLERWSECNESKCQWICLPKTKFSSISEAKIKEGIFVGPQIRELQQDGNFQNSLNEVEAAAWNSFRKVCKIFLGSIKVENYRDIVNDLLLSDKALGCNMSLKIHFLHSHLDLFPDNLGAVSDEHGERFHQDISSMEKRYQGKWSHAMLAIYCWTLKRDLPQAKYRRNSTVTAFQ